MPDESDVSGQINPLPFSPAEPGVYAIPAALPTDQMVLYVVDQWDDGSNRIVMFELCRPEKLEQTWERLEQRRMDGMFTPSEADVA